MILIGVESWWKEKKMLYQAEFIDMRVYRDPGFTG